MEKLSDVDPVDPRCVGSQTANNARMTLGINYPWAFNKYGLYFGPHAAEPWMDRWIEFFKTNLLEINELGLKVVRIFLLCAGENCGTLRFGSSPSEVSWTPPRPIDARFLENLEQMLAAIKESKTGIKLIPSLIDFGFFGPVYGNSGGRACITRDPALRGAFLDATLDPLLAAGAAYAEQIYAWEVINEPYWNCHFIAPPLYRGWSCVLPRPPLVRPDQMRAFLRAALDRIEAAGFASTVGHRFYSDLASWPGGTRPQFHYYAKGLLGFGDPRTIPEHAETGGAFLGEIDLTDTHSKLWPELRGADRDPGARAMKRLTLLERKGYPLVLIWPELEWSGPDEKDPAKWNEKLADPLKLTQATKDSIKQFTGGCGRSVIL